MKWVYNKTTFTTFRKTVDTAGSPVQFPNIAIPDGFLLIIKALQANAGNILVGPDTNVTNNGFELDAGQSVGYPLTNTNAVYIDSTQDGDGVSCTVVRQ